MKSNRTKTTLLSCGVVLMVACVCLGLILAAGLGVSIIRPLDLTGNGITIPPTEATQIPRIPEETATPSSMLGLPEELADTISQIEADVMQLRGLSLEKPIDRRLISSDELAEIVRDDFFSDYSDQEAKNDVMVLSLLGLLPEDFDLIGLYHSLYSEQIAGFYDSETNEIYVVGSDAFGGSEKLTYAHEFNHVLQDQTYHFEDGLNYTDAFCEEDSERCAAIQALIEGDSTLTEMLWLENYATRDDYTDLVQTYENLDSSVLDAAPPYIAADLYFPYEKGFEFVKSLYDNGGYQQVDGAFAAPPVSTEQILHPEKYPDDVPQTVDLPELSGVLGEGWSLYDQNVMGEWYTFLILNKAFDKSYQLSEEMAAEAAEGWGGDAYAFYLNETAGQVVFIMDSVWDTINDADEFSQAFSKYADLRWQGLESGLAGGSVREGENGVTGFVLEADRTIWVTAPTIEMVTSILTTLQ